MPLRYIHGMIASLMLEKMVPSDEPIIRLAGAIVHVAVEMDRSPVSTSHVALEICFPRESGFAFCP